MGQVRKQIGAFILGFGLGFLVAPLPPAQARSTEQIKAEPTRARDAGERARAAELDTGGPELPIRAVMKKNNPLLTPTVDSPFLITHWIP